MARVGETMTEGKSFLSRSWEAQHGKQFGITATVAGASGFLLLACLYQILFLQDHSEWKEFTGFAITGLVASAAIFLIAFPEFLRFKGFAATLEELMEINSTAELRRRRIEGDQAADALGAGHQERWNEFLESRNLRR